VSDGKGHEIEAMKLRVVQFRGLRPRSPHTVYKSRLSRFQSTDSE